MWQVIRRSRESRERGAAALEAALVLPFLLLLIFGIIDFSRAYNAKQTLTHATREAVRVFVVTEDFDGRVVPAFDAAVTSLGSEDATSLGLTITPSSAGCNPGEQVTASASYDFDFTMPPFLLFNPLAMDTQAVMRCGG